MSNRSNEKAMQLALVTGLRAALGPALIARSRQRPEHRNLALAAIGEMLYDKIPGVPPRDSALSLLARGLAGAWVAKQCQEESEDNDPWIVPLGAAVAMGVAIAAPKIRTALGWSTGLSQPVLGLLEDYLALRLGSQAVGLSMEEIQEAAFESVEHLKANLPNIEEIREHLPMVAQSAGAGSM